MTLPIKYSPKSFYYKTPINGRYLGYLVYINIPPNSLDKFTTLTDLRYVERPDLLALDYYGDDEYEWIIPVRSGLQDLIFDLQLGVQLIIPNISYVKGLING